MSDVLLDMYGDLPLLIRGGLPYPLLLDERPVQLRQAVDPRPGAGRQLQQAGERELARWLAGGGGVWNGEVGVFSSRQDDTIYWQPGLFFDGIRTSEALVAEAEKSPGAESLDDLPLRWQVHQQVDDVTADGAGRSAALSVSGLLVANCPEGRFALLGQRSLTQSYLPGSWDVMPDGLLTIGPEGCSPTRDLLRRLARTAPRAAGHLESYPECVHPLGSAFALPGLRWMLLYLIDIPSHTLDEALAWCGESDEYSSLQAVRLQSEELQRFWNQVTPGNLTPMAAASLALAEQSLGQ